ncbi:MAG: serine/threonine protein kinase [Vicinamibacteria bacterium]|nr:serine/threonine protein kinase [Vicinamibacteria bacterium]
MELKKLGKYEIVARLGAGAMGEVWKAKDPVLNRFVAVKVMSASLESDAELIQRFQREAQSAARLNHANIITVFDFGQDQGKLYMAMELLEGSDLKEVIAQRALPELWDRVLVMEQIADGLAFAHGQGIVHRDVKPANIHVLPNGRVKIMDFGLARIETSEMTHQGMVMGTPNYMAPEQVHGKKADARSDVFSCGALFYELLSGRKAFPGDSMTAILNKVLDVQPEPLTRLVPGLPVELAQIVERALAKTPEGRFPDARQMLEAVRKVRERMESGELASGAMESEATVNGLDAPTVASLDTTPSSLRSRTVIGANALDVSRRPRSGSSTRVGAPTLSGQDRTQARAGRSPLPLVAAGVLVVGGGAAAWFLTRPSAAPPVTMAPAELAREQVGILKESLVSSQIDLARLSLADKDFAAAQKAAEAALKVDAGNAEAKALRDEARQQLAALDSAASEARTAFGRGDTAAASAALARVLALDPRHPVAAELTSKLNEFFREQAADARKAMADSRTAAREATSQDGHARALALVKEGEALFASREYAVAAQKFLEARDGFDRARRAGEAAADKERQVQAAAAAQRQAQAQTTRPVAPPTSVAAARPVAPPPTAPPATAATAPASVAPATAPVVVNPVTPHEPAVRQLLAEYTAALEGKSIDGFRAVKPNLSADEAKRLSASFKAIKNWKVGIQVESLVMDGGKIIVRVQRQDSVNGRETPKVVQNFTLVQQAGAWKIESIGQ